MQTFAEIQTELNAWRAAVIQHNQAAALLDAEAQRLAPGGGIKFHLIDRHAELQRQARREREKSASASREIQRLQESGAALSESIKELRRNLATYEAQLQPGAIDWSKCDPGIDRQAHLAELRAKADKLRKELQQYE